MEYKEDSIAAHIEKRFEKLQKIGSGAYGYVWKVKDRKTNQVYALKKVFLAFQNDVDAQRTFREIAILKQLTHPNVVKLQEVIKAQNDLDLYLVFQFVQCDLFSAIRDGVLNQMHKKYIIYQLANTLVYLHSAGVLHRDLKPSNILINSNCKIKICDFGLSRTLYSYQNQPPNMTQFIATRWYRAPEVLFGSTNYSYKSDMWSLGCLIYQVYASRSLLPGSDSVNQIQKLLEFKGFPNQAQIQDINADRVDVLLSHFNVRKLPQTHYFKSTWNQNLISLLKGLLEYSPHKRWGPQQVLNCEFLSQFKDYEEKIQSKKPIALRLNDNKKHDKEFYRNFIHKIFTKKPIGIQLQKHLAMSHHVSLTHSKRNAATSMRKKLLNSSSSVSSLLHSNLPSSKTLSKTMHVSSRNSSKQQKSRNSKDHDVSPYKTHLKQNINSNLMPANIAKAAKSGNRKINRDLLKRIGNNVKQNYNKDDSTNKKVLKRKVMVYNI